VIRRWNDFWFAPAPAVNLGAARIAVGVLTLWILLSRDYWPMSDVPEVFWRHAPQDLRLRYLIPGPLAMNRLLEGIATAAVVGVILGVAPRLCSAIAALLIYHLAPLEAAIWTGAPEARGMTLAPVALLILAVAPSDAAFSVRRPRPSIAHGPVAGPSVDYGWPVRLLQLLVVEIYFFSAIGKVQRVGLDWGSPERIRQWLLWFNTDDQAVVFQEPGLWLARFPAVCAAIGIGTFLLEWGMPLALFSRVARWVLVPAALVFHAGILITMNIHVPEAWLLVVFVDWSRLAPGGGVLTATPARPTVTSAAAVALPGP
jgi:hypothetical protein